MRLIVFIALALVAVLLLKRWLARFTGEDEAPGAANEARGDLVSCARCGLHLPRSEARESGGDLYCGEEHARLGRGSR